MSELRVGQRVQLNQKRTPRHRWELHAPSGHGVVLGHVGGRVWVEFDDGSRAHFFPEEVEPAMEQIGLFDEATARQV